MARIRIRGATVLRVLFFVFFNFSGTNAFLVGQLRHTASDERQKLNVLLRMNFFSDFFGGGAYNLKINYSKLPFPCNELGELALGNQVVVHSEKYPELTAATFATGCFWGGELLFQRIPGVKYTAVGYTQGTTDETCPTYDQICAGATQHTESVILYYDPTECSYDKDLLSAFFDFLDPTTVNGQGGDYGLQYRTGIYFHTPKQEDLAKSCFALQQKAYSKPIATELKAAKAFWPAEAYHQQYLEKGGRFGKEQSSLKGCDEEIRCYG